MDGLGLDGDRCIRVIPRQVACVEMMSKGSKEALTVLIVTHVTVLMSKGLKVVFVAYVHNIDTFNAMSKGSKGLKDYVMLKQGTNTFLFITFLTFPTIPSNAMYVKGVESYFDFQPLQHASTYIALDGLVRNV